MRAVSRRGRAFARAAMPQAATARRARASTRRSYLRARFGAVYPDRCSGRRTLGQYRRPLLGGTCATAAVPSILRPVPREVLALGGRRSRCRLVEGDREASCRRALGATANSTRTGERTCMLRRATGRREENIFLDALPLRRKPRWSRPDLRFRRRRLRGRRRARRALIGRHWRGRRGLRRRVAPSRLLPTAERPDGIGSGLRARWPASRTAIQQRARTTPSTRWRSHHHLRLASLRRVPPAWRGQGDDHRQHRCSG